MRGCYLESLNGSMSWLSTQCLVLEPAELVLTTLAVVVPVAFAAAFGVHRLRTR